MTSTTPPQRIPFIEVVVRDDPGHRDTTRLEELLDEAIQLEPAELVVDLTACGTVDAILIGLLLEAHRRMRRGGGLLTLRSSSSRVRRNLQLARVDRVLHIAPARATTPRCDAMD